MPLSFSSSFLPLFLLLSIILCCALGRFFPHFSLSVFFFPFLLSSSSLAAVFASSSIIIFLLLLLLASSPITLHLLLSIFFLSFVSSSAATISSSSSSFSSSFSPFFLYSCYSFSLLLRHLHLLLLLFLFSLFFFLSVSFWIFSFFFIYLSAIYDCLHPPVASPSGGILSVVSASSHSVSIGCPGLVCFSAALWPPAFLVHCPSVGPAVVRTLVSFGRHCFSRCCSAHPAAAAWLLYD